MWCVAKERLKSPRARLFVALELPEEVREAISRWQRLLPDPPLRATSAEQLHVTLVFLGHRPLKQVDRIAAAAFSRVRSPAPSVEIAPEPVGRPSGRRPRLFALELRSPGLVELQALVERGLVEARLHEPEKRRYWPHLTVARVRPAARGSRKPAAVEGPLPPLDRTHVCRPTRLVLFRSHLRREGATYEPMAELELPTADPKTER